MSAIVRIRLWSVDINNLNYVVTQIIDIAKKAGVRVKGPVPLPVKKLLVPLPRLPHGEGSKVWDRWEMRIHKRIIDVEANEHVIRQIMRVRVPENVYIEIEIKRR
ncbi:MAG: 30S ribosomal protein S10 [Ignisphaera sp.]|nr:30S ribosomal protein S10 [Ignisphaera sp.]MCX8167516.1 30S ribosomal protein S10 [Ignisphaera sp.]MDW8084621.1 30S ribosomal protein S10 [Ignisphaera sp.]